MQGTSIPSKNDGKSDENMTNRFSYNILTFVLAWPNSLKSTYRAPGALIDKRGLICDHSQFVYINVCLLLRKYLLLISITVDFRKFNLTF
jgi:hypothetical protein